MLYFVGFAGSRNGTVAAAYSLVSSLAPQGAQFLVGCAPGVDASFRSALAGFKESTTVHCAFPSRKRVAEREGFFAVCSTGNAPSPAATLHRRTVGMVAACTHLVLFPTIPPPAPGAEGRNSRFARLFLSGNTSSSSPPFRPLPIGRRKSLRRRSVASSTVSSSNQRAQSPMSHSTVPYIQIAPIKGTDRYIAVFSSDALDATFSVVFRESVAGAVALHSFAEMIRSRYGTAPEISVVDEFPENIAVADVLAGLGNPLVRGSSSL